MTAFVIDCSIAVTWCFEDDALRQAAEKFGTPVLAV